MRRLVAQPRHMITTLLEVAGFGAVTAGVWEIFAPAGMIALGIALVLIGWLGA